ncbi:universal stress protein [Streptomyces sp. WAC 00631]|uniref:universal stress protein n=1 Tax=Streptomyces sp. WAC 00631 TaxID=2203201 RepID=UPI000F787A7D|nr:universal stress protein [Streptomyces sp. WAC 00631]MCC5033460.1 universal stress protein [Streptomyces sp. WAC 00631]
MSRPVTLGLDGSRESIAAADWAAREAELRGLPLRVVHVWEPLPYPLPPSSGPEVQRHWAERIPREATEELSARHPDLEITRDQLRGHPVEVLPLVADESELLVLGSRGLKGLTGFLVGSVGLSTAAHARRPVVLVRAGEQAGDEHRPDPAARTSAATPYKDVVLGLDLSSPSDELLEFAFDAAARRDTRLRVVHGWSVAPHGDLPQSADLEAELGERRSAQLADILRTWRQKFPGVEVEAQAVIGKPADHLLESGCDASLVVIGRRIRRSPIGTHLGAVAHAVLHHCSVPVAVVPHD